MWMCMRERDSGPWVRARGIGWLGWGEGRGGGRPGKGRETMEETHLEKTTLQLGQIASIQIS